MATHSLLTTENVARLPFLAASYGPTSVELIKTHNHVFRIGNAGRTYYLKSHTKDWYAENRGQTGHVALREQAAWQALADIGLPTPEVVAVDESTDNVVGSAYSRPYSVTLRRREAARS